MLIYMDINIPHLKIAHLEGNLEVGNIEIHHTQKPLSESSKKHPDMIILQKQTHMTNWS